MSIEAIGWAFAQQGTKANEKLVLISLANNADEEDGTCYPGRKYLTKKTGLSKPAISRHLAALEEKGLIERRKRFREDGSQTSNEYRLRLGGSAADKGGVSELRSHEPSEEPSEESTSIRENGHKDGEERAIQAVLEYWRDRYSPRAKLDPKRRSRVRARLREGFTAERLIQAIDAAEDDDWLAGRSAKSPGYLTKIHTLLRDAEQVERLEKLAADRSNGHADDEVLRRERVEALIAMHGEKRGREIAREQGLVPNE